MKEDFDRQVAQKGGSVRLASVFLTAYSLTAEGWDFKAVPTGIRGKFGDKKLATELSNRYVTFHGNITAFGENLGWKGNVKRFDLSTDSRFSSYLAKVEAMDASRRVALLHHAIWVMFASRIVPQKLPPLPGTYLSYAKSLALCEKLLATPSEGHIQQFLVAAFLKVHRGKYGHQIKTHHPHASDKFDGTFGDIEEFKDDELIAAYEVTVRPDWKNRLPDFGKKATAGKLPKYVIFASDVRKDADLCPAENLVKFVAKLPYDLAVVDIRDFFAVFCAELPRDSIAIALNTTYEYLCNASLCGRHDVQQAFSAATDAWLDG